MPLTLEDTGVAWGGQNYENISNHFTAKIVWTKLQRDKMIEYIENGVSDQWSSGTAFELYRCECLTDTL